MNNPNIKCYVRFDIVPLKSNGKPYAEDSPRYDCAAFIGYYPELEAQRNKQGVLNCYLMRKSHSPSFKQGTSTPEMRLQIQGNNFTGLKCYWIDGKFTGFAYGNPDTREFFDSKKPNPFYECKDDLYLFIINQDTDNIKPSSIEMLVLKDSRVEADRYRSQLMKGGFDDELKTFRDQAQN